MAKRLIWPRRRDWVSGALKRLIWPRPFRGPERWQKGSFGPDPPSRGEIGGLGPFRGLCIGKVGVVRFGVWGCSGTVDLKGDDKAKNFPQAHLGKTCKKCAEQMLEQYMAQIQVHKSQDRSSAHPSKHS